MKRIISESVTRALKCKATTTDESARLNDNHQMFDHSTVAAL